MGGGAQRACSVHCIRDLLMRCPFTACPSLPVSLKALDLEALRSLHLRVSHSALFVTAGQFT